MKLRFAAGLAVLGALAAPAAAAEMNGYGYSAAPPPVSWTGFYIGANVGYGWGSANSLSPDGFLAGVQFGYNHQFAGSPFVVGLASDFDWAGISDGAYSVDYLGTIRARLGFAFERIMAYGTVGLAHGQGEFEVAGLSNNQTHWGWTVGAGADFALDRNWSARAEYLYVDLGSSTYGTIAGQRTIGFDGGLLKAGVNYRF